MKNKHRTKEVQDFVESLYKKSDETIKELLKHQHKGKKQLEEEVMNLIFTYVVQNDMMNMSRIEQKKEIRKLDKFIDEFYKADAELQIKLLYSLLENTTEKTFRFYEYNAEKKEVKKIVKQAYKGRHFSENVWENETQTAKYMKKQLYGFIEGKVNVNQITTNITKLFNNSHYEARRLAQTEVSRCQSAAFDRFGIEVGIKKVKYYATLCNTCKKCLINDGKLFDFKNKPELPRHPFCQCYYDIADDETKERIDWKTYEDRKKNNIENNGESDILSNKKWLKADFSTQKKFDKHIEKHLHEYGNITEKEYLDNARKLLSKPISKDVEGFISKEGFLFKYQNSTNDFAIGRPDGYISTLYKPIEGKEHWLQQIKDYKE